MDLNQNIQFVIFDFDGTIANIESDWRGWQDGLLKIFQKYEPGFQIDNLEDIYKYQNSFFEKHVNTNLHQEVVAFSSQWELDNCSIVTPIPYVAEFIKRIKNKFKLVTLVWSNNGTEFIKRELGKMGILKFVDVVCGREFGYYIKPNPEVFEKVIYSPKMNRASYLMIGNEDDSDGVAAKAAGIRYVNVNELFK